jgi:hypothetical protein
MRLQAGRQLVLDHQGKIRSSFLDLPLGAVFKPTRWTLLDRIRGTPKHRREITVP